MSITVLKFGGTSVADCKRIESVATIVQKHIENGEQVVVVVSAMAGFTNQLVEFLKNTSPLISSSSEHDIVLSSGEQITAGLLSLALQAKGLKAQTFLGSQIPIQTTAQFGCASITNIETQHLLRFVKSGGIPIVPGFQGVTFENNFLQITTLGRGGSDTTAVALSSFLKSQNCYIYTDVDGVYSADPRIVPKAFRLPYIDYETMLSLASKGAKVLHAPCVSWAKENNIKLHILSSFKLSDIDHKTIIESRSNEHQDPFITSSITYEMYKTICTIKTNNHIIMTSLRTWLETKAPELKIQFSDLHLVDDQVSFYFEQTCMHLVKTHIEEFLNLHPNISDYYFDDKNVIISLIGPVFEDKYIANKIQILLDQQKTSFNSLSNNKGAITISVDYEDFIQTINSLHDHFLLT